MGFYFSNRKELFKLFKQVLGFGIVGFVNTFINLAIYYVLVILGLNYIFANTAAFVISVFSAYYFNGKYVFGKRNGGIKTIIRVYLAYGLTFLVSTGLLYIMVSKLKISELSAPLLILIVTVPLNFLLNRLWVFR